MFAAFTVLETWCGLTMLQTGHSNVVCTDDCGAACGEGEERGGHGANGMRGDSVVVDGQAVDAWIVRVVNVASGGQVVARQRKCYSTRSFGAKCLDDDNKSVLLHKSLPRCHPSNSFGVEFS